MRVIAILAVAMLIMFVSGCVTQQLEEYNKSEINDITEEPENATGIPDTAIASEPQDPVSACESLCEKFLSDGIDISSGPCLSQNNPDWNVTDWVCDVAHVPRQGIDELNENQCTAFRVGQAHHFVEVSTNCKMIMSY